MRKRIKQEHSSGPVPQPHLGITLPLRIPTRPLRAQRHGGGFFGLRGLGAVRKRLRMQSPSWGRCRVFGDPVPKESMHHIS
eukprot:2235325-Pyramimonas_sp.AAC.1